MRYVKFKQSLFDCISEISSSIYCPSYVLNTGITNLFRMSLSPPLQIQFILCIAHCINALATGCPFPRFISTLLLINASIFLVLFMNFYIQSYKRKSAVATAKPIESSSKVEELTPEKQSDKPTVEINNNSVESIEMLENAGKPLPPSSELADELCSSEPALACVEETTTASTVLPKDVIEPVEGLRQRIVSFEQLQLQDPLIRVEELAE